MAKHNMRNLSGGNQDLDDTAKCHYEKTERIGGYVTEFKYKAFISYSHQDDRWARWLHRRLENYRLPKTLIGKITANGHKPRRLGSIFRDREELAAAENLGEKIELALTQSETLIVICSPQSAQSHWVNEEILFFKRLGRTARIFPIIVDGKPYASQIKGRESEEAFPNALRFQLRDNGQLSDIAAEPLAADLRDHADGKRLGVLKLISGLIDVGLDELVQRDMQKNRRRVTAITSTALATIVVMGTLTGLALNARQEAEQQRKIAQARTTSAEELIEFMVTDLKEKLTAVGRLDALQVVGEKASAYYDEYPLSSHDDDALGRRARVFHFLGEIQTQIGNLNEADINFQKAYLSTQALLERAPSNPDRIFDHAQSAFWAAQVPLEKNDLNITEKYYQEYLDLAENLSQVEPDSLRSLQEKTYGYTNLATIKLKQNQPEAAYDLYQKAMPNYQRIAQDFPKTLSAQLDLATAYAWLANCTYELSRIDEAIKYREQQYALLERLENNEANNAEIRYDKLTAAMGLIRFHEDNKDLQRAEDLLDKSLIESKTLWASDKKNSKWLENYTRLILLKARINNQQQDYKVVRAMINIYQTLYIDSQNHNENTDFIFKSNETVYLNITQNLPNTVTYNHREP